MKVLIIGENNSSASELKAKLAQVIAFTEIIIATPGKPALEILASFKPDFTVISPDLAQKINNLPLPAAEPSANIKTKISAKTRQGIQMLDITAVDYFKAEDKYVIAYHANGSLLIDDTLNSLEQDFAAQFIRVHRQYLVAKNLIQTLGKDPASHWLLTLQGRAEKFPVSRRKLAALRKFLQLKSHN